MKYFGTDGIRGRAGRGVLAPENVQRIGVSLGRVLADGRNYDSPVPLVLMGRDTRASGRGITRQLTSGLRSIGVHVIDVGIVPTPAVAFLARREPASCGIVISASHNPADDNGIKLFGPDGYKATPELEQAVETGFDTMVAVGEPLPNGPADAEDGCDRVSIWIDDLVCRGGGDGAFGGLSCVLDCANGAASEIASVVFRRLGAEVQTHFASPDGTNINDGCGATAPEMLAPMVRESGAHVGFTFDGDADRLIAIDEMGNVRNGDYMLAILGHRLHAAGRLTGETIVSTVMANLGLELSLREAGIKLERTNVGDKHVAARMLEGGFILGGEQSGHILYYGGDNNHPPVTTGDGILTAILMARAILDSGEPLSKLSGCITRVPQLLVNVRVREKPDLLTIDTIRAAVEAAEAELGDQGRIVLRYSGTEPIARVMIEGHDMAHIEALANNIADKIGQATK